MCLKWGLGEAVSLGQVVRSLNHGSFVRKGCVDGRQARRLSQLPSWPQDPAYAPVWPNTLLIRLWSCICELVRYYQHFK